MPRIHQDKPEARDLPGERWLPVPGYEGWYEVSDQGRVRSVTREAVRQNKRTGPYSITKQGRVLKPANNTSGYPQVMLSKNGRQIAHRVHALVAAAFIGPYPEGKVINHIDHRRTNNAASNLEYVTQAENLQKARDAGRYLVRRSMGTPRPPEWFWRLFQPGA